MTQQELDKRLEQIEYLARELFLMVDRVKASDTTKPDEVITELDDGPMDLSHLDDILGTSEPVKPSETPWHKS